MKTVVIPGSYDPLTLGHEEVIRRAAKLFDRVLVTVTVNYEKKPLFSDGERCELIRRALSDVPNLEVCVCRGLLAAFVKERGACAIVKGVRAVADYENEKQMAVINEQMAGVQTIFFPALPATEHISSTMARQLALYGGDVDLVAPECVAQALREKLGKPD